MLVNLILIKLYNYFFSGYQVQFHLAENRTINNLPLIDHQLVEPFSPSSPLLSQSESQRSKEAVSFWIDFKDGTLPSSIIIAEDLLNGTLKNDRDYFVVIVPYTSNMVNLFNPA